MTETTAGKHTPGPTKATQSQLTEYVAHVQACHSKDCPCIGLAGWRTLSEAPAMFAIIEAYLETSLGGPTNDGRELVDIDGEARALLARLK